MKIKCVLDDMRVHVFENSVVHRIDGSKCDTKHVMSGPVAVPIEHVREHGHVAAALFMTEELLKPKMNKRQRDRAKRAKKFSVKEGVHPNAKEINEFIEEHS